jgi:hypothetical protein
MLIKDNFKNEALFEVYKLAKSENCKIYTSSNEIKIHYFTIEDETGNLAYVQTFYSGVKFSSIHKPIRKSGNGSGFLLSGIHDFDGINDYKKAFRLSLKVPRYSNFQDYLKNPINQILKYKEI